MKINMTEWAKAVIDSKKVMAVPIMTHPGIEMIGRRVIDAVSDGEVHFNAVRALAGRYDTAAATVIMDLTVEAEAFGADIAFEPDEVPAVRGHMLNVCRCRRSAQAACRHISRPTCLLPVP